MTQNAIQSSKLNTIHLKALMAEDNMSDIESRLGEKIDAIVESLGKLDVLKEQIYTLQLNISGMSQQLDRFRADITALQLYQASCPRVALSDADKKLERNIKDVWVSVLAIGSTLMGVFIYHIFGTGGK